jgi:hypothetical protein
MLVILMTSFVISTACTGTPRATTALPKEHPLLTLYPLTPGAVWSYDVDTGVGLNTLAISRVISVRGSRVEVGTGSTPIVYEVTSEGIRRQESRGWVLKSPIEKGASWNSDIGHARVVSTQRTVNTPMGRFVHCVHVMERSENQGRQVDTVYCPQVGPVFIDSQMDMKISGRRTRVSARLLGYNFTK